MPSGYLRFFNHSAHLLYSLRPGLVYLGAGDDMLQLDPFHPNHFTNSDSTSFDTLTFLTLGVVFVSRTCSCQVVVTRLALQEVCLHPLEIWFTCKLGSVPSPQTVSCLQRARGFLKRRLKCFKPSFSQTVSTNGSNL